MMRKSRFGSKTGRDKDRDTVADSDGPDSSNADGESGSVEEGVDRYERSSDRYRAEKSERAGAEGSAPARRAFGRGSGGGSGKSTFGNSTFSRGASSNGLSRSRKASVEPAPDETPPDSEAEPVYERSSDRTAARRGLASRSTFGRSAKDKGVSDAEPVYERSSEKKLARSGSSLSSRSDRSVGNCNARSSSTPADKTSTPKKPADDPDPAANRLNRARAVLQDALSKTDAPSLNRNDAIEIVSDPFAAADPFEPFEQCVPVDATYSRAAQEQSKAAAEESRRKRPQLSLRGRALGYLSRREYSRAELSRKLMPHASAAESLEELLDALERESWLSNARFVESLLHRRGGNLGVSRIVSELKRHAVGELLIEEARVALVKTELERAQQVWKKKYGEPPATPGERAKQARFLAARGFSTATIMKVLKGSDDE
jgi:SOS response regulatory protein OraA/RecX